MTKTTEVRKPYRKAFQSYANGNCIEVSAVFEDGVHMVHMRDSKNPDGPVLRFTKDEWDTFASGMSGGNFDDISTLMDFIAIRTRRFDQFTGAHPDL